MSKITYEGAFVKLVWSICPDSPESIIKQLQSIIAIVKECEEDSYQNNYKRKSGLPAGS